jgi:hypothetical protein
MGTRTKGTTLVADFTGFAARRIATTTIYTVATDAASSADTGAVLPIL